MEDHKRKSSKKKICFITLFIVLIAVVGIFVFLSFKGESIKAQVDRLLHTNQVEVIFLQRDNDPVSSTVKDVLDHVLKEQGITYTTINVTNATSEEMDYVYEKFGVFNGNCTLYLEVLKNSEDITGICESEADRDTIMYYFAREGLLNDNQLVLNEYHYNLGVAALERGNLGAAKEHLEQVVDYKDEDEILSDKRFYLVDHEFEYQNYPEGSINMTGRNIHITFKYHAGSDYTEDWIFVSYWNCVAPYGCLNINTVSDSWDARMFNDHEIELREFQSSDGTPFNDVLDIEIVSEDQIRIRIEGTTYILTKTS